MYMRIPDIEMFARAHRFPSVGRRRARKVTIQLNMTILNITLLIIRVIVIVILIVIIMIIMIIVIVVK